MVLDFLGVCPTVLGEMQGGRVVASIERSGVQVPL